MKAVGKRVQIIQIQSTCSDKHNGSGNNECILHENVKSYELENDAELGYEAEGFSLFLWVFFFL